MTNRRKGTKGKTAAKKADSPEKQTRRLSRRSRRNRKSESPEQEESDNSVVEDNTEDSERRQEEDRDDNDNQKEDSDNGYARNSEEAKAQLKEEESGGSDGSWKVKSENGGGGGIPKLKLCLTRPPEMSSPTSDSSPSPRRRGRKPKGYASPAKEEPVEEPAVEEKESPKRSTRSRAAKATVEPQPEPEAEAEAAPEPAPAPEPAIIPIERTAPTPPPETPPGEITPPREVTPPKEVIPSRKEIQEQIPLPEETSSYQEDCDSTNINHEEPDETSLAVASISMIATPDETEANLSQRLRERISRREEQQQHIEVHPEPEPEPESKPEPEPEPRVEEKEAEAKQELEPIQEIRKEAPKPDAADRQKEPKPDVESKPEAKEEAEPEVVQWHAEDRRSSSRDSSEERAKQEALLSRKRNKNKKEPKEPMEVDQRESVNEAEKMETSIGNEEESKPTSTSTTEHTQENDRKESVEEPTPVVRKRRWGSSGNRITKKSTVSISTDFLKEIIPEVKPLPISEVQLSPNEEEEEGQLRDSEDSVPVITKKVEREKIVQSEESEKDYEEEAVESGGEEPPQVETVKPAPVKEKEYTTITRKVSMVPSNDLNTMQKSPSPPRNKPSNILYIVNLVRPFTIPQLRELLARTGTIAEDGFWIDKIKSKCYVKYETEEEAKTTRHALHGVRWPVSNPKQLNVDFGTESAMKAAQEGNENASKRQIPSLFDKQIDVKSNEKAKEKEKEREERTRDKREKLEQDRKERLKHREEERREEEEREKKRAAVEPLARDRTVRRVTVPVREWDVGKSEDGFSPPPDGFDSRHRDDRYERRVEYDREKRDDYDERRRRERERGRRSLSGEPPRKTKKKSEDEAPAKLLDDLFRKTKATPCIYWLPLTAEQISIKEEMRRKHMADHEKKIAELRKIQRDQSKRSSDKRRRRTRSRSRSRSPKK